MATSKTHFAVATVLNGAGVTSFLAAGLATPREALLYLAAGVAGGCLPDIDADNSRPLKMTFHWGALALAFLVLFRWSGRYSALELGCAWLAVYLFVRVILVKTFERLTVHRGLFHSVPCALCFAALVVFVSARALLFPAHPAWWAGFFCLAGYLVHLLLDEFEGLNLFGVGTRRSMGSACKLWSRSNPRAVLFLWILAAVLLYAAPPPRPFLRSLTASETYRTIGASLLPDGAWFSSPPDVRQDP